MRQRYVVGTVLAVGVLLVGCSADAGSTGGGSTELEAELADEYDGEILTVPSLGEVAGAEPHESDGISFQLPTDWVVDRTENEEFVRLQVYDPADELNIVGITVATDATSDGDVLLKSDVTFTQLAAGGAEDLERHVVEWDTWPFAVGISGAVVRDDVDDSEFVSISGHDESASLRVGLSAQTSDGSLEDSLQYQVLRTVRPAE